MANWAMSHSAMDSGSTNNEYLATVGALKSCIIAFPILVVTKVRWVELSNLRIVGHSGTSFSAFLLTPDGITSSSSAIISSCMPLII